MAQVIPPIVSQLPQTIPPPSANKHLSSQLSLRLCLFANPIVQTSLPSDSGAAPSVEDIQDRLPSICVDYLSHDWSEEDVWASWRNMTRHKHEIANGVRLENASWRTWQKQRNKLKTISPETLNW